MSAPITCLFCNKSIRTCWDAPLTNNQSNLHIFFAAHSALQASFPLGETRVVAFVFFRGINVIRSTFGASCTSVFITAVTLHFIIILVVTFALLALLLRRRWHWWRWSWSCRLWGWW